MHGKILVLVSGYDNRCSSGFNRKLFPMAGAAMFKCSTGSGREYEINPNRG
jgi:hypothetical protein